MEFIMVTPLPPKGDREWSDLEILFKGILKANGVPFGNVKVFPQNGNTPCDVCFIRFKQPQDAARWFLLHQGALDLANPDGSKRTSYMYFSTYYWKCEICNYFNFPLRVFCYGCHSPQSMKEKMEGTAPISQVKTDSSKWVGLKKLDYRLSSTEDVINSLPSLSRFDIKTCEFMTESNGLPLGLCIFEMGSKSSAKEFLKFLLKSGFSAAFMVVNSRTGLSNSPYRMIRSTCHQTTQTLDNTKSLGDYILKNWPVDESIRSQKGTQTVLVYKYLQQKVF